MPTRKELIEQAKGLKLCCFWALKKNELEELLRKKAEGQTVPSRFMKNEKKAVKDIAFEKPEKVVRFANTVASPNHVEQKRKTPAKAPEKPKPPRRQNAKKELTQKPLSPTPSPKPPSVKPKTPSPRKCSKLCHILK